MLEDRHSEIIFSNIVRPCPSGAKTHFYQHNLDGNGFLPKQLPNRPRPHLVLSRPFTLANSSHLPHPTCSPPLGPTSMENCSPAGRSKLGTLVGSRDSIFPESQGGNRQFYISALMSNLVANLRGNNVDLDPKEPKLGRNVLPVVKFRVRRCDHGNPCSCLAGTGVPFHPSFPTQTSHPAPGRPRMWTSPSHLPHGLCS